MHARITHFAQLVFPSDPEDAFDTVFMPSMSLSRRTYVGPPARLSDHGC